MGRYFFHQWLDLAAKATKIAVVSFSSLGLASSFWLVIEHQVPQIARTQTVNTDVTLDRRPDETYEALRSRAITAARTAATQNLATNRQATDITVTVVIRDRGQIAPILSLTANRTEGIDPDPRQGIKYFDQARSLLRFDERDVATNDADSAPRRSFPNPTPSSSRTPANSNSSNTRGSGQGTFSQPGRLIPSTSEQPTNTTPFSQPGTTNSTNTPSSQTQPGTGLVPQSLPDTTPNSITPNSSNTPTNQPTAFPDSSPDTSTSPSTTTPASSSNTGITPATPATPSGLTPSQPLTPSTSPFGTTTPTTQP
ncbi:hypothetical protein [Chroococcidiopsis thermalis]|uniref:Uncharacterized protein n=1 Tax=Chroococcidiopsis thermalis (strain PCC 7203) TaxID=251229 RepID=K9TY62_CHRTP|nr:hypothetical protein [Chroococcidiopsis thermalis]AFY87313.1 hypothetical protein Chro_1797 [Chroococcidiopsis thermalis PCC 7203]PSB44152.1 hypothetical protein C7B80_21625 [Cyanosarcina cf. burmensis CCALA 770]